MAYNLPRLCASATWNPHATTAVNSSWLGGSTENIFVDTDNTLYVAARGSNSVQVLPQGSSIPIRNISTGLNAPYTVFATSNGDIYVDNGYAYHCVDRWTLNGTASIVAMYVNDTCWGLFADIYGSIYCSIEMTHQVFKHAPNDDIYNKTVVAGTGTSGVAPNMLSGPRGIFVDKNLRLYVADCCNNRVQLFLFGQTSAVTVAGNGAPHNITLSCPMSVVLDGDGYLYIADFGNNRIIAAGPNGVRCIVGCAGGGASSSQLNQSRALSFDSDGNLLVVDMANMRIQKFLLEPVLCGKSHSGLHCHFSVFE